MKTFCKYLLLLTLALSYSNVYSQTDSTVTIIELEDKDNIIIDGDIIEPIKNKKSCNNQKSTSRLCIIAAGLA